MAVKLFAGMLHVQGSSIQLKQTREAAEGDNNFWVARHLRAPLGACCEGIVDYVLPDAWGEAASMR